MNLEGFDGNVMPPGIVNPNEGQEWADAGKHMLLWRAVRLDEKRVNAEIKELVRPNELVPTEIASRKEQLPALRAELAQIHKRLECLRSDVDVWVNHAAEHRYVIEEMADSRLVDVAIDEADVIQQATEINDANEKIDALIAVKISRLDTVERQATAASPAPLLTEGAPKGAESAEAGPVDKRWVMKKAALMDKYADQWETIKGDFHSASEKGLSKAAKAPGHGEWFEADALNWAKQRGKLAKEKEQGPANLETVWTSTKHTTEG